MTKRPIVAAAAALFLLGACARPADDAAAPAAPDSAAPAADGDSLVLRVRQEGGFVPPDRIVGRIPQLSVYADGRVITEGPVTLVYPGPALPNVQVRTITPEEVTGLTERALAAGVGAGADLGRPGVADAPTTRIDVVSGGTTHTVSVEALNEAAPDDTRLTAPQKAARAKLAAFVAAATQPAQNVTDSPYEARTWAALAQPFAAPPDDSLPRQPEMAWPGPALPGEYLDPTIRIGCVEVTGAAVAPVLAAARTATADTPWTSGGNTFRIAFRPLLPDESGCVTLKGQK